MSRRTASEGQFKELAAAVFEGIPTDLPSDIVQGHIGNKGLVHCWLELGLTHDLTKVDLSQVEALLEGRLRLESTRFSPAACFSDEVRQKLEADGWEVVEIPAGVTLASLVKSGRKFWSTWFLSSSYPDKADKVEVIPTQPRQVAWAPSSLFISNSSDNSFAEHEKKVAKLSEEIRGEFGSEIQAVMPTAEEVAYLLFEHKRKTGQYGLTFYQYTRVLNRFDSEDRLYVGGFYSAGLCVDRLRTDWHHPTLYVLRFLVPRT